MFKFSQLSVTVFFTLVSGSAMAAGYGAAGCGLGSMIIGSGGGFVQVFAATTNGTSNSQTFGITSGTSNCGGGGAAPTVQGFIETNHVALANDISRGNGETLNNLTQLMGCKTKPGTGSLLQKNYNKIFPSGEFNSKKVEASIHETLKGSCS